MMEWEINLRTNTATSGDVSVKGSNREALEAAIARHEAPLLAAAESERAAASQRLVEEEAQAELATGRVFTEPATIETQPKRIAAPFQDINADNERARHEVRYRDERLVLAAKESARAAEASRVLEEGSPAVPSIKELG